MSFSVKITSKLNFQERMKKHMRGVAEALKEYGHEAEKEIRTRTQSGRDVNEKPFKPYSPGYKAYKQKIGRYAGHPDLKLTSDMQNSMESKVTMRGDIVTLELSLKGEAKEKSGWVSKTRKWFGLSPKQKIRVREILRKIFRRI